MSDDRQAEYDDVEIVEDSGPAPDQAVTDSERRQLVAKFRGGANWFFWIAALSVLNSLIWMTDGKTHYLVGLGITQVANHLAIGWAKKAPDSAMIAKGIAFAFTCLAAGLLTLIGAGSRKGWVWVFSLGILCYIFDALLLMLFRDWLSFAFHVFALFGIIGGLSACRKLQAMELAVPEPGIESAS
jgi:hypothetical protein